MSTLCHETKSDRWLPIFIKIKRVIPCQMIFQMCRYKRKMHDDPSPGFFGEWNGRQKFSYHHFSSFCVENWPVTIFFKENDAF